MSGSRSVRSFRSRRRGLHQQLLPSLVADLPTTPNRVGPALPQIKGRYAVATCIACGARTRHAECPDGCADVALDLVEAESVDALDRRLIALKERVTGL